MPIYMDRHDVSKEVTAEMVAHLHQEDLKIQDKFGCRGLTYWFDENRKTAFCLVEAPNEKAIYDMHNHAHGQVSNQIIEVDINVVESFLGRIENPLQAESNIIDEPAFRILMMTGFDESQFILGDESTKLADCMQYLSSQFVRFDGRMVEHYENHFLVSFKSVSQTIECAMEIQKKFSVLNEKYNGNHIKLKTGIDQGAPFSGNNPFFGDTVKMTQRLYYISNSKTVLSREVKMLCMNEHPDSHFDCNLFVTRTAADEKFLNQLIDFMEKNWQNQRLQVDDLGKNVGCSKSQLYRKIISLTETSPNDFIKDFRLNKAIHLMKNQSGNVSEVAYEAGFNSPSYFAKCFHKKYGLQPSAYLQKLQR